MRFGQILVTVFAFVPPYMVGESAAHADGYQEIIPYIYPRPQNQTLPPDPNGVWHVVKVTNMDDCTFLDLTISLFSGPVTGSNMMKCYVSPPPLYETDILSGKKFRMFQFLTANSSAKDYYVRLGAERSVKISEVPHSQVSGFGNFMVVSLDLKMDDDNCILSGSWTGTGKRGGYIELINKSSAHCNR